MQYKEITDWAVQYALQQGCQQARAEYSHLDSFTVKTLDAEISSLQQSSSSVLNINLFVDNRSGAYSTNRLEQDELAAFIRESIETTRLLSVDQHRHLPNPQRYYQPSEEIDLKCYDETACTFPLDDKLALLNSVFPTVKDKDPRIIHVQSTLGERIGYQYMTDSQGFAGSNRCTGCWISTSVSLQGDGESRPSDDDFVASIGYGELLEKASQIAPRALRRVQQKIGQAPIHSGQYRIIVEPRLAMQFISPLLDALYGASLDQKRSFLADSLGKQITSDIFTISDKPHMPAFFGSSLYDFEGVATSDTEIISNGRLMTFFLNTYYAGKLGKEPTTSGPNVLHITPGQHTLEEYVAQSEGETVIITGFIGGNSNDVTGDFSYGIEGLLYRNGEFVQSISEMNITGTMLDLWQHLTAVGCENEKTTDGVMQSLVFEDVTLNGVDE